MCLPYITIDINGKTKRKPATVGEILVEEFTKPIGLTQAALAEAMGVQATVTTRQNFT
jgi:plasmid maintenance system antidote protein VapI